MMYQGLAYAVTGAIIAAFVGTYEERLNNLIAFQHDNSRCYFTRIFKKEEN